MKKILILLIAALGYASYAECIDNDEREQDTHRFTEELNERDFDSLRDFLKTKREEDLQQKAKDITLSGDVRLEWRHLTEDVRGRSLRGGNATTTKIPDTGLPISRNDFDIEFNFRIDYDADRTWATAHVQYDNTAGVDNNGVSCKKDPEGYHGSGNCDNLCLKKAFFGYEIYECGCTEFYIEIGRRNMYNIFDSKIQFLSRFDGIYLHYKSCWEGIADWYWSFGTFVVDERVNQFAWITEVGFLNIYDSGFDFKYSFIDWVKNGKNRCFARDPEGFKFMNSQFTVAYHFDAEMLCQPATVYGAFVINHLNNERFYFKKGKEDHVRNQNKAWYVGFVVGEVEKEGDWSFEARYEYVQAFAIPDDDASGICNGNVLGKSITQKPNAGGNTNYKGWVFESLYALTDNITVDTQLEWSNAVDEKITGSHKYSKFEIEAIYAF